MSCHPVDGDTIRNPLIADKALRSLLGERGMCLRSHTLNLKPPNTEVLSLKTFTDFRGLH